MRAYVSFAPDGKLFAVSLILSQSNLDILQEQLKAGKSLDLGCGDCNPHPITPNSMMKRMTPEGGADYPIIFTVDVESNAHAEKHGALGDRIAWDYKP